MTKLDWEKDRRRRAARESLTSQVRIPPPRAMTQKQLDYVRGLERRLKVPPLDLTEMSRSAVSWYIDDLKRRLKKQTR